MADGRDGRGHVIEQLWYGREPAAASTRALLWPLAAAFGVTASARSLLYDLGILRSRQAPAPVISVGALTTGGSGKTPFVLWLTRRLQQRGLRPCIVTRGYGGRSRQTHLVTPEHALTETTVAECGDEAALLAARSGAVVATSPMRIDACNAAWERFRPDVFVLDDGFQHRGLARDLDIVLVDGAEKEQRLLPAGPLRERPSALRRAHVIVTSGGIAPWLRASAAPEWLLESRTVATSLVASLGESAGEPVASLAGRRVAAVAAVARPERFVAMLGATGADVTATILRRDHHPYSAADWHQIEQLARSVDRVVTTEKDLVKLAAFAPAVPSWLRALRIDVEVDGEERLLERAARQLDRSFAPEHHPRSRGGFPE
ncbi:MAG TPA: tetraacyldisaccharide 4'-kinase [Candidatus Limnocylindrales bacterium]|nr:tetraacyldisaccharide 4'-kinase [Candidatus Limnocylindrales bacterium]